MPITSEQRLQAVIDALRKRNSELEERNKFLSRERRARPGTLPVARLKKFQGNFEFQGSGLDGLIESIDFDRLKELVAALKPSDLDGYIICASGAKPSEVGMHMEMETTGETEEGDVYARKHRHTVLTLTWDQAPRNPNPRLALMGSDDLNFKGLMGDLIIQAASGSDNELEVIEAVTCQNLRQNYSYVNIDRTAEYANKDAEPAVIEVGDDDDTEVSTGTPVIEESEDELSEEEKKSRKRTRSAKPSAKAPALKRRRR